MKMHSQLDIACQQCREVSCKAKYAWGENAQNQLDVSDLISYDQFIRALDNVGFFVDFVPLSSSYHNMF